MNEIVRLRAAWPVVADEAFGSTARCERALELMLTHRGNPSLEVERALAADPDCVFGHCLRLALFVCADDNDDAVRLALAKSVDAIEAARPDRNDPARRHAAAARAWLAGDAALTLQLYGAIVVDRPRDILALAVAHALDFRLGRRRMLRDRIAQVLPEWSAAAPGYASVLAMYAFGLEENGQYRRAEKTARRALALDPRHAGAIHVVAHVLEMQGRAREGLAFLADTEPAWVEGTGYSVHLAWHRALFHLDADDPISALEAYDEQIASARASDVNALADASALLWRLRLRDVDVGERWRLLADRWECRPLAGARSFHVIHAIIAFVAAGRAAAASRAFESLPRADDRADVSSSLLEDEVAPPLCEALRAFAGGDYQACVEWLERVRHISHRCGGSVAQCDLVQLTFIEAAMRAKMERLASALVAERAAQRPASPLNERLRRRLRTLPAATGRPAARLGF
jgi:tetratricopeptide (TPR) repeat protein